MSQFRDFVLRKLLGSMLVLTCTFLPNKGSAQVGAGQIPPLSSPVERLQRTPQPQPRPQIGPAPGAQELVAPQGPNVTVRSVEVTGVTVYPPETLKPYYAGLVGRSVPPGAIGEAVREIQSRYRSDGYFLTVARGTLQSTKEGSVLRIQVIEGFISDVKIDGDVGPAGVLAYRFLEKLTKERPAKISDVERALLLVEGIPGMSARAVLRPGAGEVGAVELVAQLGRKPFSGVVSLDNRGSKFAGPGELLLSGFANSFTSLGEQTEVTLFNTPFNEEQIFGQGSFSAFVGSDGLKLGAYVGYGVTQPGDIFTATGYKGRLTIAGIDASYPVILTRPVSLTANLAFDASRATIDVLGAGNVRQRQSTSNLRILRAGGVLDFQDGSFGIGQLGANTVSFTLHKGLSGLGASPNDAPLPPRQGNINDFLKFTAELTRVQNLFSVGDYLFALKLSAAGQWTDDVLPPNEKFFLGGARYGRGFFSGEITGDRAYGSTAELQINTVVHAGALDVGLQYYAFYDRGATIDLAPGDQRHHLESAGIGVRADFTPQFSSEIELTRRFTRNPAGTATSPERAEALFARLLARF